ncbi:Uncharacterized protein HZ326_17787 [Fusarium oxysporum f. sp. albedinis]|nr:Uncharacterized protein HZ326_17787 [Fusarium oxysporum f. sp. albedinis]
MSVEDLPPKTVDGPTICAQSAVKLSQCQKGRSTLSCLEVCKGSYDWLGRELENPGCRGQGGQVLCPKPPMGRVLPPHIPGGTWKVRSGRSRGEVWRWKIFRD